jgi:hypothetical protein
MVGVNPTRPADQYREFAKEARALARRLRSDDARNKDLEIADAWEMLARDSERRSAG